MRGSYASVIARAARVGWTVAAIVVVQTLVCAVAASPVAVSWYLFLQLPLTPPVRIGIATVALVPSYVLFALGLIVASPVATWATGARTPPDATLRIVDLEWPLLRWVRYVVAAHVVRLLAGGLFRGSPVWTFYLRLNGARIGRRVYVNTLGVSDHNLLVFGDDVVIGADVHLSGHTVERGLLKTGRVTLGSGVTVGLGSVIEIATTVGDRAQIGALSFVPKGAVLDADAVYAGAPVHRLDRHEWNAT